MRQAVAPLLVARLFSVGCSALSYTEQRVVSSGAVGARPVEQSLELLQALQPLVRLQVAVRVSSVVMSTISIRTPEAILDPDIRLI
jgi:hypothetical protein